MPEMLMPRKTASGRRPGSTTVEIDGDRFHAYFWRRRIPLNKVGGLFGRSDAWASVMISRGRAGYYALDELACQLGTRVEDMIAEIGTSEEVERLNVV